MINKPSIDMIEINSCLSLLHKIRANAHKDTEYGFYLPEKDFLKVMSCLNLGSYGSRIANYIAKKLNINSSDNKDLGDYVAFISNEDGITSKIYIECKISLFTSSNKSLNLVQIRPWQNTAYIFAGIDMCNHDNISIQLFYLTKQQMESEKQSTAHGKMSPETSIRPKLGTDLYNRWVKEYGISLEALKNKFHS